MKKNKQPKVKGSAGWYRLNQKVQVFADRRTRRNRSRGDMRRRAINSYLTI